MISPTIITLPETKLVGIKKRMSLLNNRTGQLWKSLMPRKKEIRHSIPGELYSVEVYDSLSYFVSFDPAREFEKWAAVKVEDIVFVPVGMEKLVIPTGLYAAFPFRGSESEVPKMYQYIMSDWLPNSVYELDHRPHFAVMGERYKSDDPNSEEEFWVPVK
ncbi:AraC family transcriptional regulator [Algoriphagus sp. 4150]|uniref:GyrI-like domain-containing protein n=1 Tax=Algoriphagus sp. 4150 TaxID=2817756 RepID=UPI0028559E15|nr:GyrI-like domain-containing protein [Algoriphagus sp. 4150]MDR7128301.1 AraC family transcriptional regulator [Algoriphagus sp. 4150]